MPTSVIATNGESFHLFQLSTATSVKRFNERIRFTKLRNKLSDGFRSRRLLGSSTGVRSWTLQLPTLAHRDVPMPMVTGIDGATLSREEYVWDLYCRTEITGRPFVIQSEKNNQYYLVEFVDDDLDYEGMKFKLYSTGIELEQVRIDGVSVFNPEVLNGLVVWNDENSHSGANWNNKVAGTGSYGDWVGTGDVLSPTVNGKTIKRLNSVSNTGVLKTDLSSGVINDACIVLKVREAAFGQTSGILSTQFEIPVDFNTYILGLNGTDDLLGWADGSSGNGFIKWIVNGNVGGLQEGGYEAFPMNSTVVLYLVGGNPSMDPSVGLATLVQMGQTFDGNATKAEIDVMEQMYFSGINRLDTALELVEHQGIKWR